MKNDLSAAEKAVLRKLAARPMAGFEFDPSERQAVQRLVHEAMIEDHGYAFTTMSWWTGLKTEKAWNLGIFRLGAKARALMVKGGTVGIVLLLLSLPPAFAADPPAAAPSSEQILSQLLRQRADSCEQNLASQAALGAAAQAQVAELKKQLADLEQKVKACPALTGPVTTAPHKTNPPQSPSNPPHPGK